MPKIRDLVKFNHPTIPVSRGDIDQAFAKLQDEMNRLFNRFYNGTQLYLTDWGQKAPSAPAVNVIETAGGFKIEVEMAGIDPKNVQVETVGNRLTLKGERMERKEDKEAEDFLRQEISYGSFMRSVELPATAETSRATAEFKNGLLMIDIPKKAEAVQTAKKIEIKSAA